MIRYTVILPLFCSGCLLSQYRQDSVAVLRDQTMKTGVELVTAAEGVRDLTLEITRAAEEERPPLLEPIAEKTLTALSNAVEHVNNSGTVIVALQEDFGVSTNQTPTTADGILALVTAYRSAAKLYKMIGSWVKNKMGFQAIGIIGGSGGATVDGWRPKEIGAIVTLALGAVGTLAEITRRKLARDKSIRSERDDLQITADQAEAALSECNATMKGGAFAKIMLKYPAPVEHHAALKLQTATMKNNEGGPS